MKIWLHTRSSLIVYKSFFAVERVVAFAGQTILGQILNVDPSVLKKKSLLYSCMAYLGTELMKLVGMEDGNFSYIWLQLFFFHPEGSLGFYGDLDLEVRREAVDWIGKMFGLKQRSCWTTWMLQLKNFQHGCLD